MDDNKDKTGLGFWSGLMHDVFQRHEELDLEKRWVSGSIGNIPSLDQVDTDCPRPWLFARMLGLSLVTYLILLYCWNRFHAVNVLPGLIIVGTAVVPLCMVVFFFELNARRNISVFLAGRMMAFGGAFSLVFSLFMFKVTTVAGLNWMGASVAGIAEEIGKLAAVLMLARSRRYPYILNGLLFGAAVGAGFAAYESAGYALTILVSNIIHATLANAEKIVASLNAVPAGQVNLAQEIRKIYTLFAANVDSVMLNNIAERGLLAPFNHIIWTAISAGGLWIVKGDRKFTASMLADVRFVGYLLCSMVLHAVWNSPWRPNFISSFDKYLLLGVVGWGVVLTIARRGLKQLAEEKSRLGLEPAAAVEEGVKEVIRIQKVYVEKLEEIPVERKAASALRPIDKGYDHMGVAAQAKASHVGEMNRVRHGFGDRTRYRGYGAGPTGGDAGEAGNGSQNGGSASRRRWEKYYQGRGDNHDREK